MIGGGYGGGAEPPDGTYHYPAVASRTYRAEAIVLKTNDFAEADRIRVLFTGHCGKVRVVAKGIRRATSRMAGHAEPLTHATYQLARGRELDVLTGAEARAIYPDMRDDLGLIAAGWYVAELVDRFTAERVPSAPLFDLLETSLRRLDAGVPPAVVCRWFDLHLLDRTRSRDHGPGGQAPREPPGAVPRGEAHVARQAARLRPPVERDLRRCRGHLGLRSTRRRAETEREGVVVARHGAATR